MLLIFLPLCSKVLSFDPFFNLHLSRCRYVRGITCQLFLCLFDDRIEAIYRYVDTYKQKYQELISHGSLLWTNSTLASYIFTILKKKIYIGQFSLLRRKHVCLIIKHTRFCVSSYVYIYVRNYTFWDAAVALYYMHAYRTRSLGSSSCSNSGWSSVQAEEIKRSENEKFCWLTRSKNSFE